MASSSFALTALSGKIASTPSARICSTRRWTSPAEAWAWVESDGITAPTTSMP